MGFLLKEMVRTQTHAKEKPREDTRRRLPSTAEETGFRRKCPCPHLDFILPSLQNPKEIDCEASQCVVLYSGSPSKVTRDLTMQSQKFNSAKSRIQLYRSLTFMVCSL